MILVVAGHAFFIRAQYCTVWLGIDWIACAQFDVHWPPYPKCQPPWRVDRQIRWRPTHYSIGRQRVLASALERRQKHLGGFRSISVFRSPQAWYKHTAPLDPQAPRLSSALDTIQYARDTLPRIGTRHLRFPHSTVNRIPLSPKSWARTRKVTLPRGLHGHCSAFPQFGMWKNPPRSALPPNHSNARRRALIHFLY